MKLISYLSFLVLIILTSSLHSMNSENKYDKYAPDCSHASLQNLVNQSDTIIDMGTPNKKSHLSRLCSGLRRYTTTICVVGTTVMIGTLMYYLYIAKGKVKKAEGFVNQAENIFDLINSVVPDAQIVLQLAKDFFNCSVSSAKFIEDLIIARNKLCGSSCS